MKRFSILLIFLPLIFLEIFFHINSNFFKQILLFNSNFTEWKIPAPRMNYWPETIILGNSIALQGINPNILQNELNTEGLNTEVGNVAVNAGTTSIDYFTLKRILSSCKKCPKRIILQISDENLKKDSIPSLADSTLRRLLKLYYPDNQIDESLVSAANIDPYYKQYLLTIKLETSFRTQFTANRLIDFFVNKLSQFLKITNYDLYEPTYQDSDFIHFSYTSAMDTKSKQSSFIYDKDKLVNYSIGGESELFYDRFIKLAKQKGIKIYLVLPPQNKFYSDAFSKDEKLFVKFLSSSSKENNITLIDDMNYNSTNNSLFYDLTHLNEKGASVFTKYLGLQLKNYW